jgi:predicted CoA-binding protein
MNTTETISQALELKNWAVVGLGNNPDRPAFGVAKLLQDKGHQIFPVHPKAEAVHGAPGYQSLLDIPVQIDVVDCFVNSNLVGEVVDQAAADRAQAAGLLTVMDRCPAIEYQRFI